MNNRISLTVLAAVLAAAPIPAMAQTSAPTPTPQPASNALSTPPTLTPGQADAFVESAEKQLADLSVFAAQVSWINETYKSVDTDAVNARVGGEMTEVVVRLAGEAARFQKVQGLSPVTARKLKILVSGITLPAPAGAEPAMRLAQLTTALSTKYAEGMGSYEGKPMNGNGLEAAIGTVRDPAVSQEIWTSWNTNVGAPMRKDFTQAVAIANQGARDLGYGDVGALWRSGYDMPADDFAAMVDQLWLQVKPLYEQLHCYTRTKLSQKYGAAVQSDQGPIRADLLGNIWAQEWGNIYDIVAPPGIGDLGYDTGELLKTAGYDPVKMVRTGEGFYSSLGLAPLPKTFWERSQIVQPPGRTVVCHASAWDIDNKDDLRIKMCTRVDSDDFVTIHHELGHNYYQRAYNRQPFLFMGGANDGFHEAIGDTIALSITPEYLVRIGLLTRDRVPPPSKDIGLLLRQGMDKVAFLPFGLMVDKWRWQVFSGQITPANYQASWDAMRLQYQGIKPPVARSEADFDPGAKYHVANFVPYTRYFLARILQFQFYEAACKTAGWKGPLHRCTFYGNKAVGAKLDKMLEMGASRPWPDALEAFTGSRQIDGRAMLAYFRPLMTWLQQQNRGKNCGW